MMGFIVGSETDAEDMVFKAGSSSKLEQVTDSTQLIIRLNDGPAITGTIQGIISVDSAVYLKRYNAFQVEPRHLAIFPAIDDTVSLVMRLKAGKVSGNLNFLFCGFDFVSIRLRSLTDGNMSSEKLKDLYSVTGRQGRKFSPSTVRLYMSKGLVPLQSEFIIQSSTGTRNIPVEKVTGIEWPGSVNEALIYTVLGFLVDGFLYSWLKAVGRSMRM
jgi:hypothetical protein